MQRTPELLPPDSTTQGTAACSAESREARRPYQAPKLMVYGTVNDLTAKVGRRGRRDSKQGRRRTGF